jgi:prepilin peptidase CpaA
MTIHSLHGALWAVALIAVLASAYTDLKDRIIPDAFVCLVAGCGIALGLLSRLGQVHISLLAAIALLFALGALAHFHVIGGGDVKLISAASLLVAPADIGKLLVFIALAGGVLSCAYLLARRALNGGRGGNDDQDGQGWLSREGARIASGGPMPYGVAILGGLAGIVVGEIPKCLSAGFCFF